ncbi:MAG: hypothetical protein UV59_C0006G0048 [Candidatus Gottesmanbacteria bacterium GW2011_GWA1_43_11]|uniref:Uncharacterized protein n=1 Tax=Candidatus Gottesmanbacteria bacterium GW2011_GWA1_43_11 TaxID=1618436 RepID=A0A0G1CJE4_9BACT|nr:MAG: hypothetical protein UV59_C0006G0048 [Candidatus Gottesmanbacteria bacterium GW2011_GWA1_43_11]
MGNQPGKTAIISQPCMKKIGSLFCFMVVMVTGLFVLPVTLPVYAQTSSDSPGETLGIIDNIVRGLFGSATSLLGSGEAARCSDTLHAVTGNPVLADEQRTTGEDFKCFEEPIAWLHYEGKLVRTQIVGLPELFGQQQVSGDALPNELTNAIWGGVRSKISAPYQGSTDEQRGYLAGHGYKKNIEKRRKLLLSRGQSEDAAILAEIELQQLSSPWERMQPYECVDDLGQRKPCLIADKENALRAEARGMVYSEGVAEFFGLNPADRVNHTIAGPITLGWLHAPCLEDGSCSLGNTYLPTAFSTDKPPGVDVALPYDGIIWFCQHGMRVGDIPDDVIDGMCNLVVGPNYRSGQVSSTGLLWQQMTATDKKQAPAHPQAYLLQACDVNCQWATWELAPVSSDKLGVNFAAPGTPEDYDHVARLQLGFAVDLIKSNDSGAFDQLKNSFNRAFERGVTPILRICVKDQSCPFSQASDYGQLLEDLYKEDLYKQTGQRGFFAIAGPNEANSETWLGNKEGDAGDAGARSGAYSQQLVADLQKRGILATGATANGIRLLSPAFNTDYAGFETEATAWKSAVGAAYSSIIGIAGNAYNKGPDAKISKYVDRVKAVFPDEDKGIYLTESGMYESAENPSGAGVPRAQALLNLAEEVRKLALDSRVQAINIFNGFGKNPDFKYNALTDSEFAQLTSSAPSSSSTGEVPISYFESVLNPLYNASRVEELGATIKEHTSLEEQDQDAFTLILEFLLGDLFDVARGEREARRTYPGGIEAVVDTLDDNETGIAFALLPFSQVEACKNDEDYEHDINTNINDAPTIDSAVVDVIAGDGFAAVRDYTLVNTTSDPEIASQIPAYDPANPITQWEVRQERGLNVDGGVPKKFEPYHRYAVNRKCGVVNNFLSFDIVEDLNSEVSAGVTAIDLPQSGGSVTCATNSVCSIGTYKEIGGGINLALNPRLANGACGLLPCTTLPFDASQQVSAGRMVRDLVKAYENVAVQPWKDLGSFQTQQNLVQENPILSLQ